MLRDVYVKVVSHIGLKFAAHKRLMVPTVLLSILFGALAKQRDRWSLWCPVALICGIAAYFALPREPHLSVFIISSMLCIICGWLYFIKGAAFRVLLACFLLAGFSVAKVRTNAVDHVSLVATTPTAKISGVVDRVEFRSNHRARIYLKAIEVENIKQSALPHFVRLSGKRPKIALFSGDKITVRGRLVPLPQPVEPGGFDFGRKLWFQEIGATGFYYGEVEQQKGLQSPDMSFKRWLQQLRSEISYRISQSLPEQTSAVAKALITGDRGQLDKQTLLNLRTSGLAHILAISGLHMTLVAGGVFWLTRALLAMSGLLALGYPIKKWAAVTALAAGVFYLAISGASIATQRAFIMLSIMLLAIILDRPAISMRNVAMAALAIAIVRPETILSVSFQMSFMAVVGLVGFYELLNTIRREKGWYFHSANRFANAFLKLSGFFLGLSMTTIIAGVFTGVPAAYHFNTIAVFSLIGNVVALPIVTLVVMPSAIASVLLMPFGLEAWGLNIMGMGIELVLDHAQTVASYSGARMLVPSMQTSGVLLLVFGLLWFSLWHRWLKALAIVPVAAGVAFAQPAPMPDVLISKYGRNVAVANTAGRYVFVDNKKGKYDAERWLVGQGDPSTLKGAAARKGWRCDSGSCVYMAKGKKILYLGQKVKDIAKQCQSHNPDIVIAANPLFGKCKSVKIKIDRFDLWREGAHAIFIKSDGKTNQIKVISTRKVQGLRPWVIKPKARRKILIDPTKDKRRYQKTKPFPPKKNVSFQFNFNNFAEDLQVSLEH